MAIVCLLTTFCKPHPALCQWWSPSHCACGHTLPPALPPRLHKSHWILTKPREVCSPRGLSQLKYSEASKTPYFTVVTARYQLHQLVTSDQLPPPASSLGVQRLGPDDGFLGWLQCFVFMRFIWCRRHTILTVGKACKQIWLWGNLFLPTSIISLLNSNLAHVAHIKSISSTSGPCFAGSFNVVRSCEAACSGLSFSSKLKVYHSHKTSPSHGCHPLKTSFCWVTGWFHAQSHGCIAHGIELLWRAIRAKGKSCSPFCSNVRMSEKARGLVYVGRHTTSIYSCCFNMILHAFQFSTESWKIHLATLPRDFHPCNG